MIHIATYQGFVPYRRTRAFFLFRIAQHVRSANVARELARALLALAGAVAWGVIAVLLGGA
jgi:hypothetical protein